MCLQKSIHRSNFQLPIPTTIIRFTKPRNAITTIPPKTSRQGPSPFSYTTTALRTLATGERARLLPHNSAESACCWYTRFLTAIAHTPLAIGSKNVLLLWPYITPDTIANRRRPSYNQSCKAAANPLGYLGPSHYEPVHLVKHGTPLRAFTTGFIGH